MKKLSNIFWIVFLTIPFNIFAQQNKPIETGFVFIDGKYIEAPYIVKRKGMAVYINDIQITKEVKIPPKYDKRKYNKNFGIPPGVNKNTSLDELFAIIDPETGVPYFQAQNNYLYTHYPFDEALSKSIEYYESMPNIKSITKSKKVGYIVETYSGEKRNIWFGDPHSRKFNSKYGPNGKGPMPKKYYKDIVKNRQERYERRLIKGDLFLFFSYTDRSYAEQMAAKMLPEFIKIMENTKTDDEKMQELFSLSIIPRKKNIAMQLIQNYNPNEQLKKRTENLTKRIKEKYGEDAIKPVKRNTDLNRNEMFENRSGDKKQKDSEVFSPNGMTMWAGCPCPWDISAYGNTKKWGTAPQLNIINSKLINRLYDL